MASDSSVNERDAVLIKKIEHAVEAYKNHGDPDFMEVFFPHLTIHSVSQPGGNNTTTSPSHPSATFAFTVRQCHCNRLGTLHGGAAATLFDFCTTMPLALVRRPGFWGYLGVTRTLSVNYLRPAALGETVLVECEIVHVGKRLCSLRGVMRRASDGEVLATCEHGKFNTDEAMGSKA